MHEKLDIIIHTCKVNLQTDLPWSLVTRNMSCPVHKVLPVFSHFSKRDSIQRLCTKKQTVAKTPPHSTTITGTFYSSRVQVLYSWYSMCSVCCILHKGTYTCMLFYKIGESNTCMNKKFQFISLEKSLDSYCWTDVMLFQNLYPTLLHTQVLCRPGVLKILRSE